VDIAKNNIAKRRHRRHAEAVQPRGL
jgi:hypothetical protein